MCLLFLVLLFCILIFFVLLFYILWIFLFTIFRLYVLNCRFTIIHVKKFSLYYFSLHYFFKWFNFFITKSIDFLFFLHQIITNLNGKNWRLYKVSLGRIYCFKIFLCKLLFVRDFYYANNLLNIEKVWNKFNIRSPVPTSNYFKTRSEHDSWKISKHCIDFCILTNKNPILFTNFNKKIFK